MSKKSSPLLVAAAVTVAAAVLTIIIANRTKGNGRNEIDKKKSNPTLDYKDGSQEALVDERFQACAQVMKPYLAKLSQQTQLDYYALYKQGTVGDCSEYQSRQPVITDIVATAKYNAWSKIHGMDRMTAMQNYVDKAVHFQFVNSISDGNDDEDYELEGDAVIEVVGLGDKPSTLLSSDAYGDISEQDTQYPLHAAAREGELDKLITLLLSSQSVPSKETAGSTGSKDEQPRLSPNDLDSSGQSALHLAADRGHVDCVKALILAGGDINSVDHEGISVLQACVISGDVDCCKLLLILGANADQPDHDGDTPRDSAEDDEEMNELFALYDDGVLSTDDLSDPDYVEELQNRNILIPEQHKEARG